MVFLACIFALTSCNTVPAKDSSDFAEGKDSFPSPFSQFENLEKTAEAGIDSEQVDNILRTYNIYEELMEEATETGNIEAPYSDVSIRGFNIGNKKAAVLQIVKGHLYIYIMFSKFNDKWTTDGFTCLNERYQPEYRIEQSSDSTKYWLVIKYEANHGTGLQIFNEAWYNPDGTIAADYPLEGYAAFFPQMIMPAADAKFSASADYDGNSAISLSYAISFMYHYESKDDVNKYVCEFSPVIREHWEYNLKTLQLEFIASDPALSESFSMLNHEMSAEFGVLQGYIDFYGIQLRDKTIATLEEWERFINGGF
jgi:hypothetical protein